MTPQAAHLIYRRMMAAHGETVAIRRYTGTGQNRPRHDTNVMARVMDYKPEEIVGTIQQGDRKVILAYQDLIHAQFAIPVKSTDKLVVRGKELAIQSVDDNSRRIGTELIAYVLQVRG